MVALTPKVAKRHTTRAGNECAEALFDGRTLDIIQVRHEVVDANLAILPQGDAPTWFRKPLYEDGFPF